MRGVCPSLFEESIDERRFAVVDVRDDGDIADFHGGGTAA